MVTMMKNQLTSLNKKFGFVEEVKTKDSLISSDDLEKLNLPPDAPIALSKAGEQALVEGDDSQFVGLCIDEDRQPELTDERVENWVKQIYEEMCLAELEG